MTAPCHRSSHRSSQSHPPGPLDRAPRPRLGAACLAAVLTLAPATVPGAAPAAPGQTVDFRTEPFRVESIGLTLNLPVESDASTTWTGQIANVRITPPDSTWMVTVQSAEPKDPDITPDAFADKIIEQLGQSTAGKGEVLERKGPHQLGGRDADAFYYEFPPVGSKPPRVNGYAVVANAPNRVVTFTLVTTEPELPRARVAFEGMLATVEFSDPKLVEARRAAAVANAQRLLTRLQRTGLDPFLTNGEDRWQRLYEPASTKLDTDAEEHGYRRIRSWRGQRGEMDPQRSRARWSSADHDEGYLVKIDSRLLLETEIIDATSTYFLSLDREQEAWKTTMAIKPRTRKGRPAIWKELGARAGSSLNVKTEGAGQPPQTVNATIPDTGYLSQVETLLIPTILAREAEHTDYGFYSYRPARNRILYRSDHIERPEVEGGRVRLESVLEPGRDPVVSMLTSDGTMLSRALPDGRVWEPIELERLYDVWRDKGLPIE